MNTNNATNMHMTAEVWNALVEMMDVNQLSYFIEYLEQVKKVLISDEVVTNCVEDSAVPTKCYSCSTTSTT